MFFFLVLHLLNSCFIVTPTPKNYYLNNMLNKMKLLNGMYNLLYYKMKALFVCDMLHLRKRGRGVSNALSCVIWGGWGFQNGEKLCQVINKRLLWLLRFWECILTLQVRSIYWILNSPDFLLSFLYKIRGLVFFLLFWPSV